jgi:hypothetical protein
MKKISTLGLDIAKHVFQAKLSGGALMGQRKRNNVDDGSVLLVRA